MHSIFQELPWQPPEHWSRIRTIDMHTGGEPLRVITSGLPPIHGNTVLEKRRYFRDHLDHLRTGLMWEPRGHADMYGAVITPSNEADFDVFFLHNEGYSTMCGHAIIALTRLVVEAGLVGKQFVQDDAPEIAVSFAVPCGKIHARAHMTERKVRRVSFKNVPSFMLLRDGMVEVPGIGQVRFDIAYGGAFYAIVAADDGLELIPENFNRLIRLGRDIKQAVARHVTIEHPFEPDLSFLYGTIFTSRARDPAHHSRNVCIFADGELDRSPTGSGVSARAALHHAKRELTLHESITIESILGSTMSVKAVESVKYGPHEAVIPEVSGTAHVTGRHELMFDPDDPFRAGFIFR